MFSRNEIVSHDLCNAFLSANIPLEKLNNPQLKQFLEEQIGVTIPDASWMRKNYVPMAYDKVMGEIKAQLQHGLLWVSCDASRDAMGREAVIVLIGRLEEQYHQPFVCSVEFRDTVDGNAMAR